MNKLNINKSFQSAVQHYQAGNLQQAERILKKILKVVPGNFDAQYYLGNILQDNGQDEEAITCYQKAIELKPHFAGTYFNIAAILHEEGRLDEAMTYYRKVLKLDPGYAGSYNSIGVILQAKGQLDEAIPYYRKAIELDTNFSTAYTNLGNVFLKKELLDEAISCYQKALQLNPDYAKAYCNLGIALQEKGLLDEAIAHYQKALQLNPGFAEALNNLGRALQAKGQFDEAEMCYRRAVQIKPDDRISYQNLLLLMLYNPRYEAQTIFFEHLKFANQFEGPLLPGITPHRNEKTPGRRLRIGYVSPDFRRHSVAYFIEPVIAFHNREDFEIFCYSLAPVEDEVTDRIRGYANHWTSIVGMSDAMAAESIREDGIDILVDLSGHTSNNRILLFARKPSPVQVSWIGYPATTGLSTMDYKIVDGYTDPPGLTDPYYTEHLLRLPESFLCYLPDKESPEVKALPALKSGHITFGSFNNFTKETPEVLALWSEMLKRIPHSRLILKAKSFTDGGSRDYVMGIFAGHGIDPERIELLAYALSFPGHLGLYNRIDIALDPFPYNGTTTTCEALWMGVPVITLAGNTHASRVGMSLLSNIGLPEFVAKTSEEYLAITVNLADDLNRLRSLRESLRERMNKSALTDSKKFIAGIEALYRRIWEKWCVSS